MSFNRNSNLPKKMQAFFTILLVAGFLIALPGQSVSAQTIDGSIQMAAGTLETPAFIDDNFRPALAGGQNTINRTFVQPDGKILVAGNFHMMGGTSKNAIARFNADGTLDTAFNTKSGANNSISAIGMQSDGKIIVGGNFTSYAGNTVGRIARLNPDGSFDVSFNSSGIYYTAGANSTINEISVMPDNRIYISGFITNYNGTAITNLARLNPNGNIDTTFVTGTGLNGAANVIRQISGGKILIGGSFTTYNGTTINRLARINGDGSLDTSFNIGTGANSTVRTMVVLPDDKIIIGGQFATFNAVAKNGLARLNADGSDDAAFSVSGTAAQTFAIARQSDGKLIVGGSFNAIGGTTRRSIARLNADGSFDATFDAGTGLNTTGTPIGTVNDLALQPDGSVFLGGSFTSYNGTNRSGIARANTSGALDAGFSPSSSLAGNLFAIARQTDGKVLIGGQFGSVNDTARSNIARLNADGTLDATFAPGTGANGIVEGIAVQADGKILIGGTFTGYNGTTISRIARLNADGTLDTSFNPGTGTNGDVLTIATQADGKILIGGGFTTFNSGTMNNMARLNADGSLDGSFAIGTGVNGTVRKFIVQPDGKILVGGEYATFNGAAQKSLLRLNADGSLDASFNIGTGVASGIKDMIRHDDGKIVIVGAFTTVNGTTRNRVARLNSDGSLDTSFDPGVGFAQDVLTITALPDGKYMVGGSFTTASGLPRNRIARLRSNGALDTKFQIGLGPNGGTVQIRAIVPHNGKFLLAGQFETFNTSARTAVLLMSNISKVPVDFDGDGITDVSIARHSDGQGPMDWWIKYSSNDQILNFIYGIFTVDGLQPGDFDGDGRTDIAIWRGFEGNGYPCGYWITFSSTNQTKFIPYGLQGDRTVLEDYDGDGKDDMAIYRAPNDLQGAGQGTWIYRGSFNNPNGNLNYVPFGMRYGTQSDQTDDVYPGDFDGDGRADFRVQRRIDTSVTTLSTPGIFYTLTATGNLSYDYFGWAGDRSIPGDYDGDGKTDLAIARGFNSAPSTTTWFIRYTGGAPDATIQWGAGALDVFVQGDYDGDGTTDMAVYRRAGENNYYVRRSSDLSMMVLHWGAAVEPGGPASDVPLAVYNNR
ncbi:MAG TPA: hypothetical protein VGC97_05880 [Pyrinomonadaceae bacterium]|jgi:uncharacterized delta-60 repeat protein